MTDTFVPACLTEGHVFTRDGSRIEVTFDTICIHADMPGALDRLHAIRERLGQSAR